LAVPGSEPELLRRRRILHERAPASRSKRLDGLAVDVMPPPEREVEEKPRFRPPPRVDEPPSLGRIEEVGAPAQLVDLCPGPRTEPRQKPFVNGDAEALLRPIDDLIRDETADGHLEDVF